MDRFEIATESLHTDSVGDATLNTSRGGVDDKRHDSQSDDDEHKITMRSTVNNNVSINSSRHSDERSANGNASSNDDAGSDDESTTNKGKQMRDFCLLFRISNFQFRSLPAIVAIKVENDEDEEKNKDTSNNHDEWHAS